jgi:hypothetical protein
MDQDVSLYARAIHIQPFTSTRSKGQGTTVGQDPYALKTTFPLFLVLRAVKSAGSSSLFCTAITNASDCRGD